MKPLQSLAIAAALSMPLSGILVTELASAQEPPSKRFTKQDVPLAWIFDEWYRKSGTQIPMYACVCVKASCDPSPGWPFRAFAIGQTIPTLGPTNRNDAERVGFRCSEIPASEFPLRGLGG